VIHEGQKDGRLAFGERSMNGNPSSLRVRYHRPRDFLVVLIVSEFTDLLAIKLKLSTTNEKS
jgi:hypothetical protein